MTPYVAYHTHCVHYTLPQGQIMRSSYLANHRCTCLLHTIRHKVCRLASIEQGRQHSGDAHDTSEVCLHSTAQAVACPGMQTEVYHKGTNTHSLHGIAPCPRQALHTCTPDGKGWLNARYCCSGMSKKGFLQQGHMLPGLLKTADTPANIRPRRRDPLLAR